ncbi:MAG: protein phosphatase 2C domain-containing protein [Candidatus Sedimenticola sp. (ex Thyasira tokunagai)]
MSTEKPIVCDKSAQISLIGDRMINQDRCIEIDSKPCTLLALADGMGGHPQGESASQIFIDTCKHYLKITPQPIINPGLFLTRLLHKAHENILTFGYEQTPPIEPRTTAVAVLIQNGNIYWAHAGDSRFYLIRKQRVAYRTTDHSYVERLLRNGLISADEQNKHPQRNYVTRCLGGSTLLPNITLGKAGLDAGDMLLLCSDGLWGKVSDELICEVLFNKSPLFEAVRFLAEEATQKGFPESDNVTLLAARMIEGKQQKDKTDSNSAEEQENLASAIAELQSAVDSFESEKEPE